MKVKIIRQPHGRVQGLSLDHYHAGAVYDLPPSLAEYLVMEDYAIVEMRAGEKPSRPVAEERRRRA